MLRQHSISLRGPGTEARVQILEAEISWLVSSFPSHVDGIDKKEPTLHFRLGEDLPSSRGHLKFMSRPAIDTDSGSARRQPFRGGENP